jgi:hypothetical protein
MLSGREEKVRKVISGMRTLSLKSSQIRYTCRRALASLDYYTAQEHLRLVHGIT